jgi:hypothetical protein
MRNMPVMPRQMLCSTSWANTGLVGGDAVDAMRPMKQEARRPMRTLGSRSSEP